MDSPEHTRGEKLTTELLPSNELAWVIGVLSLGGTSSRYEVCTRSVEHELVDRFREVGEQLFGLHANTYVTYRSTEHPNWNDVHDARFHSVDLSRALGDLRRYRWAETLRTQHSWISQKEESIWSFLSGAFDARGDLFARLRPDKPSRYRLRMNLSSLDGCLELTEFLSRVGIDSASVRKEPSYGEGVRGIGIYRQKDIRHFALHVTSCVARKEAQLEACRMIQSPQEIPPSFLNRMLAYEQVLDLHEQTGWGAVRLAKHPEIVGYALPYQTIEKWLHAGQLPHRATRYGWYPSAVGITDSRLARTYITLKEEQELSPVEQIWIERLSPFCVNPDDFLAISQILYRAEIAASGTRDFLQRFDGLQSRLISRGIELGVLLRTKRTLSLLLGRMLSAKRPAELVKLELMVDFEFKEFSRLLEIDVE